MKSTQDRDCLLDHGERVRSRRLTRVAVDRFVGSLHDASRRVCRIGRYQTIGLGDSYSIGEREIAEMSLPENPNALICIDFRLEFGIQYATTHDQALGVEPIHVATTYVLEEIACPI